MTLEELYNDIEKIRAIQNCRNCFGVYKAPGAHTSYWELLGEWANREDDIFAATWGTYLGKSGVVNCYIKDHGDVTDPKLIKEAQEAAAAGKTTGGYLIVHHHAGDRIIVAEDGKTARMLTYATGNEIFPSEDGGTGHWVFIHYGVDFVRDADNKWRIWHARLIPGGLCMEGHCWTELDPEVCMWGELPSEMEEASEVAYEQYKYNPEATYPVNYPEINEMYRTFGDLAPGYGVDIF